MLGTRIILTKIANNHPSFPRPNLGKECNDCQVPIDPTNRQCSLCLKHYPIYLDYDKDRCEFCGGYDVYMNHNMQWWCDECQLWIESTNEGNGEVYGDCYECERGYRKNSPEDTSCEWCP